MSQWKMKRTIVWKSNVMVLFKHVHFEKKDEYINRPRCEWQRLTRVISFARFEEKGVNQENSLSLYEYRAGALPLYTDTYKILAHTKIPTQDFKYSVNFRMEHF